MKKNGKKANGKQNYLCKNCQKQFQAGYAYRGADPQIKQLALKMAVRGSGIRDIAEVLGLHAPSTVDKLRRAMSRVAEPRFEGSFEEVQIDEFWSFTKNRKGQKRWCWYAYAPKEGKILAFHIGKRNQSACKALFKKLKHLDVGHFCTDNFKPYQKVLPPEKHVVGKAFTTHIERRNRDFRTHLKRLARKTVCHSKSDEMHYLFINHYISLRNAA